MSATTVHLEPTVARLRSGDHPPMVYIDEVRSRIETVEGQIHALTEEADRWERVDGAMESLANRYPTTWTRPSLFGVPVGIKDVFHVDGLETRAGSTLPPEVLTGDEASVVSRLIDAGAVVLGKTVTAEFAYFEPGPTRNPHNPNHTPGGSSSGSAAAVAAGMCPLALGTQTIGSITRPAAFCGILGVKPTYGRVPTDGLIPVAPSVDTVGFFVQDRPGARRVAGVLIDEWRSGVRTNGPPTVGAVQGPYLDQTSSEGRRHFESHVGALERTGFEVHRVDPFENIGRINERHRKLVAAEAALAHAEWYPEYGDRYADATVDLIEDGKAIGVAELASARRGRSALWKRVQATMDEHGIDVIVSPAAPGPAPEGIGSTGDPVMNLPWTHAGLPTVGVPASATVEGLPLGLQCAGRKGHDEELLSWIDPIADAVDAHSHPG